MCWHADGSLQRFIFRNPASQGLFYEMYFQVQNLIPELTANEPLPNTRFLRWTLFAVYKQQYGTHILGRAFEFAMGLYILVDYTSTLRYYVQLVQKNL